MAEGEWATNGDKIYNTNSGNVGIGTTAPGAKLNVRGNYPIAKFDSSSIYGANILLFSDYDSTNMHWRINAGGQDAINRKDKLNFVTANDQGSWRNSVMTLQQDGKVGIGTTTPLDKFDVYRAGGATLGLFNPTWASGQTNYLSFRHGDGIADGTGNGGEVALMSYLPGGGDVDLRFYTTNYLNLNTDPTLTLTGNSNVGIGTTLPLTRLHIRESSGGLGDYYCLKAMSATTINTACGLIIRPDSI